MRVGLLLDNSPPEFGGGHTFIEEIMNSLTECGGESSHTFMVFYDKNYLPREGSEHITYVPIALPRKTTKHRIRDGVRWRIQNALNVEPEPDRAFDKFVVNSGVEMMWHMPFQRHIMEVPYITTVWDLQHRLQPYFPEVSSDGSWDVRERIYSTVLRRAAFIIVGTEAGKREVELFYQISPDRIRILSHPTPQFRLVPQQKDGEDVLRKHSLPRNYLFYPAQFWPHKNHVGILQALRLLRDKFGMIIPAVFTGSDQGNLNFVKTLVCDLGLKDQVFFPGFVSREDLYYLYRNAIALVYPSFFGPENLPPLEAFSVGCPVIAADVPGASEQLGDAALLVNPKNDQEIALAVEKLHNDNDLRQMLVSKGLERAARFTGRDFVRGVFKILDEFSAIRRCWKQS